MDEDDISEILETVLLEFGVKTIDFQLPRWVQALPIDSDVVQELIDGVRNMSGDVDKMKDYDKIDAYFESASLWQTPSSINLDAGKGKVMVDMDVKRGVFFDVASKECGVDVKDEYDMLVNMKELCHNKQKIEKLSNALEQVETLGYGIVAPTMDEIELKEPEILRQGGQYGVRLKANAPSLHIMKVDVETEVSPIVGSEEQSKDLVEGMMSDFENDKQAIWNTNIFGRSLSTLVADGIQNKLQSVPNDAEQKLRKTLGRIVNEGKGGVICILL